MFQVWTDSIWGIHELETLFEGFKEPLRRWCGETLAPTFKQEKIIKSFFRVLGNVIFLELYSLTKARQKQPPKPSSQQWTLNTWNCPPRLIRSFKNAASVDQFQIEQTDKNKRRHMLVIQSEQSCFHSPAASAVTIAPIFSRLLVHLSPAQSILVAF